MLTELIYYMQKHQRSALFFLQHLPHPLPATASEAYQRPAQSLLDRATCWQCIFL